MFVFTFSSFSSLYYGASAGYAMNFWQTIAFFMMKMNSISFPFYFFELSECTAKMCISLRYYMCVCVCRACVHFTSFKEKENLKFQKKKKILIVAMVPAIEQVSAMYRSTNHPKCSVTIENS